MSTKQQIFLTGATGYIGGSVLARLLKHKDAQNFHFVVLVRSEEKARLFSQFGVEAVVGSLKDHDKLENISAQSDYVFAIADVDDLGAAQAILRGLKRRKEVTGKAAYLIHTSGTGVLAEDAKGLYASEKVYDDSKPEDIESLPLTQIHRPVDVEVINADKEEGYVNTYIICPSTIYGIAKNELVDAGIQNPHSIQMPQLIRAGIARGQGGMVGEGKNLWPNVHVDDVSDLYIILFDRIRADPEGTPHGREGYFFGASDEYRLYDVAKVISEALYDLGKSKSPEPTSFTQEDLDKYFEGSAYGGSNSRCVANRSRSIGWKPKKFNPDFFASMKDEVEALLRLDEGKGFVSRADGGKSKE